MRRRAFLTVTVCNPMPSSWHQVLDFLLAAAQLTEAGYPRDPTARALELFANDAKKGRVAIGGGRGSGVKAGTLYPHAVVWIGVT
jgi:hypothetical protein